ADDVAAHDPLDPAPLVVAQFAGTDAVEQHPLHERDVPAHQVPEAGVGARQLDDELEELAEPEALAAELAREPEAAEPEVEQGGDFVVEETAMLFAGCGIRS